MSETVLVLAPHGRDAKVASDLLRRNGIETRICDHLPGVTEALREEAGAALVAEEALAAGDLSELTTWLDTQEPWSDFPFVVLANGHKGRRSARALETLDRLRNVVLLERPLHAETLIRAIRSALNGRRRQYGARDILAKSREELERLVVERTREREDALAQLHEAQKLETIGQLTGGLAHDFNNLLTPVMGNLDMLRRRIGSHDSRSQRLIENALQATGRAATLVQRLLAFARRQDLQPRPVDISTLLIGVEDLIARSIGPTVSVRFQIPPRLPAARVDPSQLELAILNLAINARDAMPDGGDLTIEVAVDRVEAERDHIPVGDYVRIAVVDSGVGMDAATLRRAVEPFFTTKGVGRGTGLGLSMVHGLAAQSGGHLALSSSPGSGTRAELWLPVAADEELTSTEVREAEPIGAPRAATVLVVDDEELVRTGTAEMLADLGYKVVHAGSGAEALGLLRRGEFGFDLIVSDHLMPGMSGADLLREAQSIVPDLPGLLVTGYTNLIQGPGAELPRLAKPFRQADMAARVAELLQGERNASTRARLRPSQDGIR